ncbi:MAG: hypothetical protein C4523_17745 [Myxococcales bacterium]|nr:MAG: hypothetical protein C4523_17745 [Myxococcales bacterium]
MAPIYDLLPKITGPTGRTEGVYTTIDEPVLPGPPQSLVSVVVADAMQLPPGGADCPCELCVVDAANPLMVKEVFSNWSSIDVNTLVDCVRRYGAPVSAGDIAHIGPTGSAYNLLCDSVKALGGVARIVAKTPGHYATFAEAQAVCQPGDVIVAYPGVYEEYIFDLRHSLFCIGSVSVYGLSIAADAGDIEIVGLATHSFGAAAISIPPAHTGQATFSRCLLTTDNTGWSPLDNSVLRNEGDGRINLIDCQLLLVAGTNQPAVGLHQLGDGGVIMQGGSLLVTQDDDQDTAAAKCDSDGGGSITMMGVFIDVEVQHNAYTHTARGVWRLAGDDTLVTNCCILVRNFVADGGAMYGLDSGEEGPGEIKSRANWMEITGYTIGGKLHVETTRIDLSQEGALDSSIQMSIGAGSLNAALAKLPPVISGTVRIEMNGTRQTGGCVVTENVVLRKLVVRPENLTLTYATGVARADAVSDVLTNADDSGLNSDFVTVAEGALGWAAGNWEACYLFCVAGPNAGKAMVLSAGITASDKNGAAGSGYWKIPFAATGTPFTTASKFVLFANVIAPAAGVALTIEGDSNCVLRGILAMRRVDILGTSLVKVPYCGFNTSAEMALFMGSRAEINDELAVAYIGVRSGSVLGLGMNGIANAYFTNVYFAGCLIGLLLGQDGSPCSANITIVSGKWEGNTGGAVQNYGGRAYIQAATCAGANNLESNFQGEIKISAAAAAVFNQVPLNGGLIHTY